MPVIGDFSLNNIRWKWTSVCTRLFRKALLVLGRVSGAQNWLGSPVDGGRQRCISLTVSGIYIHVRTGETEEQKRYLPFCPLVISLVGRRGSRLVWVLTRRTSGSK